MLADVPIISMNIRDIKLKFILTSRPTIDNHTLKYKRSK
jgi:hypothetical protein